MMATPYKTSSGKWCVRVFDFKDADGKIHQKRFYGATKKEVLSLAREFEYDRERQSKNQLTVAESVIRYIEKRRPVVSPSTINGYETIYRVEFSDEEPKNWREKQARAKRHVRIGDVRLAALTSDKVQEWINDLTQAASPKRVKNIYGLLISAVRSADRNVHLDVVLPQSVKPDIRVPTSAEVKLLLDLSEGTPLHLAIGLAAFASLRAGEVAALKSSDLEDGNIHVRHAMTRSGRGKEAVWVLKSPKTTDSRRIVPVPPFLAEEIQAGGDDVVRLNPSQISNAYIALVKRSGIEHTRFHDLRHFYASFHHAAGTPDQYIMEWGGWSSDRTLKEIYRNTLADERQKITERMNALMTEIFA